MLPSTGGRDSYRELGKRAWTQTKRLIAESRFGERP